MSTLFELSTELESLEAQLSELEDDAEQQELLISKYLQTSADIRTKLDGYCSLIQGIEYRAEIRKAEAKRLSDRATVDSNLAKRLKAKLLWFLKENEIKKVETNHYQISRAKNGGKQPLIINEDIPITSIDERFHKVSIDFDKESIRLALENNEKLDFAYLAERQENIRIK